MMETMRGYDPLRPQKDVAAEGMWRFAAGEGCQECWEALPESQKEWWRSCAMLAMREWLTTYAVR
jgi:hypothetical protein